MCGRNRKEDVDVIVNHVSSLVYTPDRYILGEIGNAYINFSITRDPNFIHNYNYKTGTFNNIPNVMGLFLVSTKFIYSIFYISAFRVSTNDRI